MVTPLNDGDYFPQRRQQMKRLMTLGMPIAATLVIAACGSAGSSGNSNTSGAAAPSGPSNTTVAVRQLPGVGSVLIDHTGKALYANNLETAGKILCDSAACNAFWTPVTTTSSTPTAASGAGKLGVITRPDGKTQVTANGHPLYTFSEDSPGKATGNNFQDQFNGHNFTWNVVRPGGTTANGTASGSSVGAPNSTSNSSGNGYG
jgi:predicted lipoprotein with Yx(FWY)xxD motif